MLLGGLMLVAGCNRAKPTLAGGRPVSYWIEELHRPDAGARRHAVARLGNVGDTDPSVPPALRGALDDSDATVRVEAIKAILKCGSAAREAVPTLRLRQDDPDARVRDAARKALQHLQSS
jgi:HEAT repeat protein